MLPVGSLKKPHMEQEKAEEQGQGESRGAGKQRRKKQINPSPPHLRNLH
jgi:hypothetical protein